jgi:hypothetical protein
MTESTDDYTQICLGKRDGEVDKKTQTKIDDMRKKI